MHATHEAELDLPTLPTKARHVYIVPELKSAPLLSVGQLCDNNCSALFEKHQVTIFHDGQAVLSGTRLGPTHLWQLSPSSNPQPNIAPPPAQALATRPSFLPSATSIKNIVAFLHAALGSPTISTLQQALDKGYIHTFPGLTSNSIRNHPPFSVATIKGHQDLFAKICSPPSQNLTLLTKIRYKTTFHRLLHLTRAAKKSTPAVLNSQAKLTPISQASLSSLPVAVTNMSLSSMTMTATTSSLKPSSLGRPLLFSKPIRSCSTN